MIKSFKCSRTKDLASSLRVKRFEQFESVARRKIRMLEAAAKLSDLKVPPNNRLEALKGDRIGQHSIRINDQWRLCFIWNDGQALDVEIVDYHD